MHSMKSACKASNKSKLSSLGVSGAKASPFNGSTDMSKPIVKKFKQTKNEVPMAVTGSPGRSNLAKRARGGRVKHAKTNVNVIVAPQGGAPAMPPIGAPMPGNPAVAMARPPVPAGPPVMPAGAGAGGPPMMPPGAAPMGAPGMMRKRGGRVMTAGAGSGEGREEKAALRRKKRLA